MHFEAAAKLKKKLKKYQGRVRARKSTQKNKH